MTTPEFFQFVREWGLPLVIVALLIWEVIVPKGRLKREENRADQAMGIAENLVPAVRENTTAINGLAERVERVERRLEK